MGGQEYIHFSEMLICPLKYKTIDKSLVISNPFLDPVRNSQMSFVCVCVCVCVCVHVCERERERNRKN